MDRIQIDQKINELETFIEKATYIIQYYTGFIFGVRHNRHYKAERSGKENICFLLWEDL